MGVENLRWWHWLLLSLVLGGILGAAHVFYGPGYDQDVHHTLMGTFDRDVANAPIDPKDKNLRFNHPDYLVNLVVHPPLAEDLRKNIAYVVNVRSGDATWEVEVMDGKLAAKRDKGSGGDSLILPVYWTKVPAAELPAEVSSAATGAIASGTIVDAYRGPTKIKYQVEAMHYKADFTKPKDPKNPNSEMVLTYDIEKTLHEAPVPYKVEDEYNALRKRVPGAVADTHFDSSKAPREFPTVMAYLDQLKQKYPASHIAYRYAWWDEPRWVYGMWIGGSVLGVGIIWPAILYLLVNAGFGRVKEPEYDLSRFKGEKKPAAKGSAKAADLSGLNALNEQLEAGLMAGAKPGDKKAATGAAPAATEENENPFSRRKAATPAEQAEVAAEKAKSKEFGTEDDSYYPTEIHASEKKKG